MATKGHPNEYVFNHYYIYTQWCLTVFILLCRSSPVVNSWTYWQWKGKFGNLDWISTASKHGFCIIRCFQDMHAACVDILQVLYCYCIILYTVKPAQAVTCIKRSPFNYPVIANFIWIEPILRGHLSYKATFSFSQWWPLNTGLTVYSYCFIFILLLYTQRSTTFYIE